MTSHVMDADIVIAGAGLAGCTLASLLARGGIKCLVVDGNIMSGRPPALARALAITPASANILASVQVWQRLKQGQTGRFSRMHVWDENSPGEISFDSADICEPVMGYIVEQSILESALDEVMTILPGLTRLRNRRIASVTAAGDGGVTVRLDDGSQRRAAVLAAADGFNSPVRQLAGLAYDIHDYQQQAVTCMVTTTLPHEHTARQRFLHSGPLAFLPMPDSHMCGVVWSTHPDHARELLAMPDEAFCRELERAFESRLGGISACSPRAAFALHRAQAQRYTSAGLVLLGDAAHCIHPLAGQGANMGLLDAAVLAELMLAAQSKQRSIGSRLVLRRYERWRKGENFRMMMALDVLQKLFGHETSAVRTLRGIGLTAVDSLPFLKTRIMRLAMGLDGDLPAVAMWSANPELN